MHFVCNLGIEHLHVIRTHVVAQIVRIIFLRSPHAGSLMEHNQAIVGENTAAVIRICLIGIRHTVRSIPLKAKEIRTGTSDIAGKGKILEKNIGLLVISLQNR